MKYIDLDQYFLLEPEKRVEAKRIFKFSDFDHLNQLFSKEEIDGITIINRNFGQVLRSLDRDIYLKGLERFIIKLSWKSSKIEGNTYSLLETEALIKQSVETSGHSREEALMILTINGPLKVFSTVGQIIKECLCPKLWSCITL